MQYWGALLCTVRKHLHVLYTTVLQNMNIVLYLLFSRALSLSAKTGIISALHCTSLGCQHPANLFSSVATSQSIAHRATFVLMATVLGETFRLHAVHSYLSTLRYCTACRKRIILTKFATMAFLPSFRATVSKAGVCSSSEAWKSQLLPMFCWCE